MGVADHVGHGGTFVHGGRQEATDPSCGDGNRYCGLVILFDIERIEPIAIMPDGVMQKLRVAALSAVGAKYLAPIAPKQLGLFGSGWQASAHLEYLCAMFDFERIRVYSPNSEHCREFAASMAQKLGRRDRCRRKCEGSRRGK